MQCYKCRKYITNKQESWTTCKKASFFYDLSKISSFRRLIQNPTPKLAASFFSSINHSLDLYFPKSLGPYKSKRGKNLDFFLNFYLNP